VAQAISVGDVLTYLGVAWVVVAGMRRREPGGDVDADPDAGATLPEVERVGA
jgi:hypothetical protein